MEKQHNRKSIDYQQLAGLGLTDTIPPSKLCGCNIGLEGPTLLMDRLYQEICTL